MPPAADFENSAAFVVLIVAAFPFIFASIWCFVLWIASFMSGWRSLASMYRYRNEDAQGWVQRGGGGVYRASLPFAGMHGRLAVGAATHGIIIKPPFLMRPFHAPLFLPFDKILGEEDKTLFIFQFVMLTMQDAPDVRVGLLKSARERVETFRHSAAP